CAIVLLEEQILDELLGNRGATLDNVPGSGIANESSDNARQAYSSVLIKGVIFGRQNGCAHIRGDQFQIDRLSIFVPVDGHDQPVIAIKYLYGSVRLGLAQRRGIGQPDQEA